MDVGKGKGNLRNLNIYIYYIWRMMNVTAVCGLAWNYLKKE